MHRNCKEYFFQQKQKNKAGCKFEILEKNNFSQVEIYHTKTKNSRKIVKNNRAVACNGFYFLLKKG
jgi:guanylate kinase